MRAFRGCSWQSSCRRRKTCTITELAWDTNLQLLTRQARKFRRVCRYQRGPHSQCLSPDQEIVGAYRRPGGFKAGAQGSSDGTVLFREWCNIDRPGQKQPQPFGVFFGMRTPGKTVFSSYSTIAEIATGLLPSSRSASSLWRTAEGLLLRIAITAFVSR